MAYLYELYLIKLICVIVENRMVNAFKLFISAFVFCRKSTLGIPFCCNKSIIIIIVIII